jgi:excisionase family DNA binding protein
MKLIDIKSASQLLSTPVPTLRGWIQLKKIPYVKICGSIRFEEKTLEKWAEAQSVPVHKTWR